MNPRRIVLIVSAGMAAALLMKAPELFVGIPYAVLMSVSFVNPARSPIHGGSAESYVADSGRIHPDSIERTDRHGGMRYCDGSADVSATYGDGTVPVYQVEHMDVEVLPRNATNEDVEIGAATAAVGPDFAAELAVRFPKWPVHEVALAEPCPLLRFQLGREAIRRHDGSAAPPGWAQTSEDLASPIASTALLTHGMPCAQWTSERAVHTWDRHTGQPIVP